MARGRGNRVYRGGVPRLRGRPRRISFSLPLQEEQREEQREEPREEPRREEPPPASPIPEPDLDQDVIVDGEFTRHHREFMQDEHGMIVEVPREDNFLNALFRHFDEGRTEQREDARREDERIQRERREREQELIDESKKKYKDARRDYKDILARYEGISTRRDDLGSRFRGRGAANIDDLLDEERERADSPIVLQHFHPLATARIRIKIEDQPNPPNNAPVAPQVGITKKPTVGAPLYLPIASTSNWRVWTPPQVGDWISQFLTNQQHVNTIIAAEISGTTLEFLLMDPERFEKIGIPHGQIAMIENHFNAVYNNFHRF